MKKKLILITILIVLTGIALKTNVPLREAVLPRLKLPVCLQQKCAAIKDALRHKSVKETPPAAGGEDIAIYFKNGSVLIGKLISKDKNGYLVNWKGDEIIVYAEQVARVGSAKESLLNKKEALTDEEISQWWPYENNIVLRLTNRMALDGEISSAGKEGLTLRTVLPGAGYIEQDVERAKLEYLIFKPVDNPESRNIEEALKQRFPKMRVYKEGNFTIVTDSYITWVQEYKKTLRDVYTDIYLNFFGLLKDRQPAGQNFIVIFDDYGDFFEYAGANGVPAWAVLGYFDPAEKVLYLFNVLGEKFSRLLFEAMVGESGRNIDDFTDSVESCVDKRYHIFIEGETKKIKDKFWDAYNFYKGCYREMTMSTLRHEFTHGAFSNWGLQNIRISKIDAAREIFERKKKELLEAKDCKEKAELAKSLLVLGGESLEVQAANSWLAEGLATYCETEPIGALNERWLFYYQKMKKEGSIYPLETLTFYKIGSFPGVCPQATLYLYAQSWAMVTFLMDKYPRQFLAYQEKMSKELARGDEDIQWLLQATGKDLRTLEGEFVEYMNNYAEVEDPYISNFIKMRDIFNRF